MKDLSDFNQAIILIALGAFVDFTVGFTGIGGAVLMTPALILLLGMPIIVAIAIDIPYAATTKTLAVYQHARQDNLRKDVAKYFIAGGLPGLTLGIITLMTLRDFHEPEAIEKGLETILAVVLLGVALVVMYGALARFKMYQQRLAGQNLSTLELIHAISAKSFEVPQTKSDNDVGKPSFNSNEDLNLPIRMKSSTRIIAIGLGCLIGIIVGLTSVGSGTLITASLLIVFRMKSRHLVGTSLLIAWSILVLGAILYFFFEWTSDIGFYLPTLCFLLLGSLPGAFFGSKMTARIPDHLLNFAIGLVIFLASIVMLL